MTEATKHLLAFNKIKKSIESSTNSVQLHVCANMIAQFKLMFLSEDDYEDLKEKELELECLLYEKNKRF
jgi:hypothetical protein